MCVTERNLTERMCIRYLLRFFDCLAHPNLSATFATDQKWPICHLRISYQSLAGGLRSLQKSEFLKLIISFFHHFCSQNWNQWHKMSGKNTHIRILKLQAITLTSNSHYLFIFFTWKIKIINFNNPDFCKLWRLPAKLWYWDTKMTYG